MSGLTGQIDFRDTFQVNPITFTGGIAGAMPGAGLPIINLTSSLAFAEGPLGFADAVLGIDDVAINFQPLAGATVIDFEIGQYPFANQSVAANAMIAKALAFSLAMYVTASDTFPYPIKFAVITALINSFKQHNIQGGTYTVATPSLYYTSCLLLTMRDISEGESQQPQNRWQLDFVRPLLTLEEAQATQNTLMSKLSGGQQVDDPSSWSGLNAQVGQQNPLITPSLIPGASGAGGAAVGTPPSTPVAQSIQI